MIDLGNDPYVCRVVEHFAALLHCAVKQARDKDKKEKKEKTKEKEKEEAPPPAAAEEAAAAAAPAADDEDKLPGTKRDEPKKKIGNVFALFNQSQIQEFKEVCLFSVISELLFKVRNTYFISFHLFIVSVHKEPLNHKKEKRKK